MLTIALWLWHDPQCRTKYTPEDVNIAARMIHRNLTLPHRFVLLTDQVDAEYDPLIKPVKLWDDWHQVRNSYWRPEFPQCYVRLKAFSRSEEMKSILGDRFVSIDLDCVVKGNLDKILGRKEDFLIYRHPVLQSPKDKLQPYNASMFMMNTGCRPQVWEDFKGPKSLEPFVGRPELEHFLQTDQGWIAYKLGLNEAGWTMDDGVYMWSYLSHKRLKPPRNARIVFFNGLMKPRDYFWIAENYV